MRLLVPVENFLPSSLRPGRRDSAAARALTLRRGQRNRFTRTSATLPLVPESGIKLAEVFY